MIGPFLEPEDSDIDTSDDIVTTVTEGIKDMEVSSSPTCRGADSGDMKTSDTLISTDLQFYRAADEKGTARGTEILMNETVTSAGLIGRLRVIVCLPDKMVKRCNTQFLSSLPETFKAGFFMKRTQEAVSLYKCLEAFLKEEPLGPEDMW